MILLILAAALAQDPAEVTADEPASLALQDVYTEVERLRDVQASMANGVVHLTGTVPSTGARDEAARIAAEWDGTVFVDNQLQVEASDGEAEEGGASVDGTIETALEGIYQELSGLDGVTVDVTSGVVRLGGEVLDESDREKAVALAETVDGVVYVDNGITRNTQVNERLAPALRKAVDRIQGWISMLPLVGIALLIIALAWFMGRALARWDFLYGRARKQPLLRTMLGRLIALATTLIGVIIAFEMVGAASLVGAVAGAAGVVGLAFGFAFQDIVENYLAGILLSIQQPFSKDDLVEVAGQKGVVVRLSMRNTLLMSPDGNHVYLPNADVFKSSVMNFTRNTRRRFSFAVGVGTDEDLVEVIRVGERILGETPGVLAEPPPRVRVEELGDSTVTVMVYGWVEQVEHDFLAVRTEAIRRIKEAYDHAGFDMPEPIYRVRMSQQTVPETHKPKPPPTADEAPAVDLRPDRDLESQVEESREQESRDLLNG